MDQIPYQQVKVIYDNNADGGLRVAFVIPPEAITPALREDMLKIYSPLRAMQVMLDYWRDRAREMRGAVSG